MHKRISFIDITDFKRFLYICVTIKAVKIGQA